MAKHDRKGRTAGAGNARQSVDPCGMKGGVWLPTAVLTSPAFVHLPPLAVKVLLAIHAAHGGQNNGRIHLSVRAMHKACGTSHNPSVARAVQAVCDHGFAEVTSGSDFNRKRLAREFRLTYIQTGEAPRFVPASNDYLSWSPPERTETIASDSYAGNEATASVSYACNETSASETYAMGAAPPVEGLQGSASVSYALINIHHPHRAKPRHDPEWMQRSAGKMLAAAPRGAKARLAEAVGATPVQISRLLNKGTPLPSPASDRLAAILNNGTERRRFGEARA